MYSLEPKTHDDIANFYLGDTNFILIDTKPVYFYKCHNNNNVNYVGNLFNADGYMLSKELL